jgi:hypothetical protein
LARFRYVRGVRLRSRALTLAALAALTFAPGCRHRSKTPDDAFRRFSAAVQAGDGGALFDALDQETRWDLMSIQKWHREAYDIVLSNYPEGTEREREKRRFERRATASSARELFRTDAAPTLMPMLEPLAIADPKFELGPGENEAAGVLPGGVRIPFARGQDGGWGFAGLAKRTNDEKVRAFRDLEMVRNNAADYERAAARAAR